MDVFATLRNIAPDGEDVYEMGQQGQPVPVAKGWLRASHRETDPELDLPWRPYHAQPATPAAEAGRGGAARSRDLADLHGVREGPPHPARHPAARRLGKLSVYALQRRLTTPA